MSSSPSNELTDFNRLRKLFEQGLSIAPAEREAWLQNCCQDDSTLCRQLREMLSTSGASFLQKPAQPTFTMDEPVQQQTSNFIGPYRLVRELGRGGMGVVFLAVRDDGAFQKKVALKLLLSEMVSPEFVLRFKHERQVVAALDHTNIARILDGGDAPDGMPYYVMEYVEGVPIDKYCDDHRLSLSHRVQLFQQVCQAVHYLHQNLIVHRDIKPSNILVSADGVVKLLDFGIAKMVGAAAYSSQELTGVRSRPMTPVYASPEQIQGATLQPASDIYSLGVVLYKLITGRTPYQNLDQKIEKLAAREDPPLPSANIREDLRSESETTAQLRRMMMGGLDSIVLMAMRFDPKKRYQSSIAFSNDLQNFLNGESMTAHHEAYAIRSMKAIKRKRMMLGVAAIMLVLAGIAGWQYTQAVQARSKIAQLEALGAQPVQGKPVSELLDDVLRLKNAFASDFSALPAGSSLQKQELLDRGLRYLDKVRSTSPTDQKLSVELADAYRQLGTLQGRQPGPKSREHAIDAYQKAAGILVVIIATFPDNTRARNDLDQVNSQLRSWNVIIQPADPHVPAPPSLPPPTNPVIPKRPNVVVPESRPEVREPKPNIIEPAEPASPISRADYTALENDLGIAETKIESAENAVSGTANNLQAQGQSLNADIARARSMMHLKLRQARSSLTQGDAAAAKANLDAANAFAERVLHFAGR